MAGTDRTTVVKGPGTLKVGTLVIHSEAGITLALDKTTEAIGSDLGPLDDHLTDQIGKTTLIPAGEVSAELLAYLFPHQTPNIGASLFGATDTAIEIHTKAGQKITLHNGAVTKPPQLRLSATGGAFSGAAEITNVVAKGKKASETSGFLTIAATEYALGLPGKFVLSGKFYTAAIGATSFPSTEAGFQLDVTIETEPVKADDTGTLDLILKSVTVECTFTPKTLDEAGAVTLLGILGGRGASQSSDDDFVVTATDGLTVTLKRPSIKTVPLAFGASTNRIGAVVVTAHIDPTDGALYEVAMPEVEEPEA